MRNNTTLIDGKKQSLAAYHDK